MGSGRYAGRAAGIDVTQARVAYTGAWNVRSLRNARVARRAGRGFLRIMGAFGLVRVRTIDTRAFGVVGESVGVAEAPEPARAEASGLQRRLGNRAVQRMLGAQRPGGALQPGAALPEAMTGAIEAARGRGRALDAGSADRMGEILGHDLRDVRVHDDAGADALCEGLAARAFTTGGDIFFARGQHAPGSARGDAVLAHELTHVVQQGGPRARGGGPLRLGHPGSLHEHAAERVARGEGGGAGSGTAVGEVQRLAVTTPAPTSLTVVRGALTRLGEGNDAQTKYIHWPNTPASGVTLGKGYDCGNRTIQGVKDDLTAAGMGLDQATKISAAATLKGDDAKDFVAAHKTEIGEISASVQTALLATMLDKYTEDAHVRATTSDPGPENVNAAGREAKEGVAAGTYVMTEAEWTALHPAMVELLTDLIYQGGYYGWDRVAKINAKIKAHPGDDLEQFKAVRELFTGDYMDNYAATQSEGISAAGSSETWYGQTVQTGGKYRRVQIRLAYLNHVITALEAGQTVVVDGAAAATTTVAGAPAAGTAGTTHVVQAEETLAKIAAQYGISVEALKAANPGKLKTWGAVQGFNAGETVTIPGVGGAPAGTPAPVAAPVTTGPDYMAMARAIFEALSGTLPVWPVVITTLAMARKAERGITELRNAFMQLYHMDLIGVVRRRVEDSWFGGMLGTVMSYFEGEPETIAAAPAPVAAAPAAYVATPIAESVGQGGKNKARDVKLVQANLVALGYLTGGAEVTQALALADDAVVTDLAQTIAAIREYQQFGLGLKGTAVDGRIDADGNTWNKMSARMAKIHTYAAHTIAATAIAPVLTTSDWVSQFPSDADKNGDGRGILESEKPYAGKQNIKCCFDAAAVMVKKKGGSLAMDVPDRLPTLLQQNNQTRLLNKQAELGVKYIDEQLLAGKPVMIGVDKGGFGLDNADQTTDHFVVIVAKVIKDGKIYYRYFDPGTHWGSKGYSEDNLLLIGTDYSLTGKSYDGSHDYRMSQARQNV